MLCNYDENTATRESGGKCCLTLSASHFYFLKVPPTSPDVVDAEDPGFAEVPVPTPMSKNGTGKGKSSAKFPKLHKCK